MKSSDIRVYGLPKVTNGEIKDVEENLAIHFYISGTSLQRIEVEHLLKVFQICRDNIKLANQKKLCDELLTSCYQKVKKTVDAIIQINGNFVSLITDAWSNVKNEPVVNCMAVNSLNSLLLDAVNMEEQGHNANRIAQILEGVMDSLQCNISGAVTDNTFTNKKAWKILEKKIPKSIFLWMHLPWVPYTGHRYTLSNQDCLYIPECLGVQHHIQMTIL